MSRAAEVAAERQRRARADLDARVLGVLADAGRPVTVAEVLGALAPGRASRPAVLASGRRLVADGLAPEGVTTVEGWFKKPVRAATFGAMKGGD